MPYSLDSRQRVIDYIENGGSISSATRMYKVGRSTIYRWLVRVDLRPTKVVRRRRKLDWQALEEDVKENPDLRLCERAQKWGVHISSISYALQQMKITRKKRVKVSRKK
jgi:putative transposase